MKFLRKNRLLRKKIDFQKESLFLKKCEKNAHTGIAAKARYIKLIEILQSIPKPKKILDVGGTLGTAYWFEEKFPEAEITILNNSQKELSSYKNVVYADAQNFRLKELYDLIFAGEIIEHVYNPDGLIASCLLALKPRGYFIITSPNLSCIYNRIFLLLGWTPGNYTPSIRYLTGNPFLANEKITEFGNIGDHKSVFTWKGLFELLKKYGFQIVGYYGYSYAQEEKLKALGNMDYEVPRGKLRLLINKFLPTKLKEGMMFICQAPRNINQTQVAKGILKKHFWEI